MKLITLKCFMLKLGLKESSDWVETSIELVTGNPRLFSTYEVLDLRDATESEVDGYSFDSHTVLKESKFSEGVYISPRIDLQFSTAVESMKKLMPNDVDDQGFVSVLAWRMSEQKMNFGLHAESDRVVLIGDLLLEVH